MNGPAPIGDFELLATLGVTSLAALASWRVGLGRRLLWAAVRAVVQLFAIGEVLAWVLEDGAWWGVFGAMTVMVAAAAHQAVTRPERRVAGGGWGALLTLGAVGLLTVSTVTRGLLHLEPWYAPRYAIPLLGMILGNTLTGLSLAWDHLLEAADVGRAEIEADLAEGATRWEAMRGPLERAVRVGMTPILNATSVVGLVSLPGMMTGQILAGASPRAAVRYQLMVMLVICAATLTATAVAGLFVVARVTDGEHRLRPPIRPGR